MKAELPAALGYRWSCNSDNTLWFINKEDIGVVNVLIKRLVYRCALCLSCQLDRHCVVCFRSWSTSKWRSVTGWWTVRISFITRRWSRQTRLAVTSLFSYLFPSVRCAGDGGFCGSRWSSDVQDLWEGEGPSHLPDGETEKHLDQITERWSPKTWMSVSIFSTSGSLVWNK